VSTASAGSPRSSSPTVLRILLGAQLRRLREDSGLSRVDAGYTIRASESKMSRMETGRVGFKERDVADLLMLYGVTDPDEREQLVALARQANEPGWWQRYSDILPAWFQTFIGLEQAASVIRSYEAHLVPGLLQTQDYAREIVRVGRPEAPADEIERRVSLRMQRQQLLNQPNPPRLWVVVDEAALHRQVGAPGVMRAQLDQLIASAKLPHVVIQLLPLSLSMHAAEGHSFVIFRFGEPDAPDVVYLELLSGALYLEKREDVELYAEVMDRLSVQAQPPDRTAELLIGIRDSTHPDF
jgi:hypothetical protein